MNRPGKLCGSGPKSRQHVFFVDAQLSWKQQFRYLCSSTHYRRSIASACSRNLINRSRMSSTQSQEAIAAIDVELASILKKGRNDGKDEEKDSQDTNLTSSDEEPESTRTTPNEEDDGNETQTESEIEEESSQEYSAPPKRKKEKRNARQFDLNRPQRTNSTTGKKRTSDLHDDQDDPSAHSPQKTQKPNPAIAAILVRYDFVFHVDCLDPSRIIFNDYMFLFDLPGNLYSFGSNPSQLEFMDLWEIRY